MKVALFYDDENLNNNIAKAVRLMGPVEVRTMGFDDRDRVLVSSGIDRDNVEIVYVSNEDKGILEQLVEDIEHYTESFGPSDDIAAILKYLETGDSPEDDEITDSDLPPLR